MIKSVLPKAFNLWQTLLLNASNSARVTSADEGRAFSIGGYASFLLPNYLLYIVAVSLLFLTSDISALISSSVISAIPFAAAILRLRCTLCKFCTPNLLTKRTKEQHLFVQYADLLCRGLFFYKNRNKIVLFE